MASCACVAHAVGTACALVERAPDVVAGDRVSSGLASPVVRFLHDICDPPDFERQPLAMLCEARRFLDQTCDADGVHGLEAVHVHHLGDQAGVVAVIFLGARDRLVEVGLHLEQAREVCVGLFELMEQLGVAEQHDLDGEWNAIGRKTARRRFPSRLRCAGRDADLAALERRLQRLPRLRRLDEIARVDQQRAAVGAMQRPGPDRERRSVRMARRGRCIEMADERGGRRQHRKIADRRTFFVRGLLRHHGHEMAGEDALLQRGRRTQRREVGCELLAIGDQVRFEIGDEGRDLGQVREVRRERIERIFDRAARGLFVEFGDLPAMILLRLGRAAQAKRSSSVSSAVMRVSTSRRMVSGSWLKTSDLTTRPSCIGAMPKPSGVRRTAMFC